MARFVTQNAHAFDVAAAFDFAHELAFQFHQPRMGQIKWNGETGNAIGREPLSRQPDVWLETDPAIVQFAIETFDVRFEKRSLEANRQIANASVEQSLIRDETPFESSPHGSPL